MYIRVGNAKKRTWLLSSMMILNSQCEEYKLNSIGKIKKRGEIIEYLYRRDILLSLNVTKLACIVFNLWAQIFCVFQQNSLRSYINKLHVCLYLRVFGICLVTWRCFVISIYPISTDQSDSSILKKPSMLEICLHLHYIRICIYVYTRGYAKKRTWLLSSMMKKLYSMILAQHCMRFFISTKERN